VRAGVSPEQPVAALAMQLQRKQPDLGHHQYDPLAQIQEWAGVPLSRRLFDSLVVFQNYIVDESVLRLGEEARIKLLVGPDATNYPVTLVAVPGPCLRLKVMHRADVAPGQATTMLADLRTVLAAMDDGPEATAGSVLARLPAETRGLAARAATQRRPRTTAAYVAPSGQMEEVVAAIWRELFEVDEIGMDDNFFDLGGHSLLLVRAHERLVEQVRPDLPIVALFQHPTARALATYLSGNGADVATKGTKDRALKQRAALARMKTAKGRR
jgi:hypothetical protein